MCFDILSGLSCVSLTWWTVRTLTFSISVRPSTWRLTGFQDTVVSVQLLYLVCTYKMQSLCRAWLWWYVPSYISEQIGYLMLHVLLTTLMLHALVMHFSWKHVGSVRQGLWVHPLLAILNLCRCMTFHGYMLSKGKSAIEPPFSEHLVPKQP